MSKTKIEPEKVSLYLCWRCMKRFVAPPKGRQTCPGPDKACARGGGVSSRIVADYREEPES